MLPFNEITKLLAYILFCLLVYFYIQFFYANRRILKFAWSNKGFFFPVIPVFGTTYLSLFTGKKRNLLAIANWLRDTIGAPVNFFIGSQYHYVTVDAEEIKTVFNHPKCFNKSSLYHDVQNVFGKSSLAFIAQDEWRGRRRHFLKSFKPSILRGFMVPFYKYSTRLVEDIKKLDGGVVSYDYMYKFSFTTFCVTALGLDEQKFGKEMAEFGGLREKIEELMTEKVINPFIPFSLWINFFPTGRQVAVYMKKSEVILQKIIQEKKAALEGNQDYIENSNEVPLLDLILSYNRKMMTDEEIFEEMVLFTSAATETSSYVLLLGFTLLGMHPDVQEKLYNEVIKEIGDNDISPKNVGNLKYTDAVIYEVLRLLPILPFVARVIGEDVDLGNNRIIPKGTDFVASVYHLHREPKYWKDPEKFDPTRFLPENADKIVPASYMPFSIGPRDCIGKNHAMALLRITYANIIRNFKIVTKHKSLDELELCSSITLYPSNPVDLRFILREKA